MRYARVNLETGDSVYYVAGKEKIAAVIVNVDADPKANAEFDEMYKIRISTNRCRTYQKGMTLTTSGNFLRMRGKQKKAESVKHTDEVTTNMDQKS